MRRKLTLLALAAGATTTMAQAETLVVSGWYAAPERGVAELESLSVDRFQGNEGPALAAAIEQALGAVVGKDGRRYFTIRSGYGEPADAIIDGTMQVRVDNSKFKRKARRCAADTRSKDCKDAEKVEIELQCTRRIVSAAVNLKIIRTADDSQIYARSMPQRNEVDYCEDEKLPPGVDAIVDPFVAAVASQLRAEIAPYARSEKIRIRETRTGLAKADSAEMKALILVTDDDPRAACSGWAAMEARGIAHPTLRFNLGLCAESMGDLDRSLAYYRAVSPDKPADDVRAAIGRVQSHMAGLSDWAEREARR